MNKSPSVERTNTGGRKEIWLSFLGLLLLCAVTIHRCQLPFPQPKEISAYEPSLDASLSISDQLGMADDESQLNGKDEQVAPQANEAEDLVEEAQEERQSDEELSLRRGYTKRDGSARASWREHTARVGSNRRSWARQA